MYINLLCLLNSFSLDMLNLTKVCRTITYITLKNNLVLVCNFCDMFSGNFHGLSLQRALLASFTLINGKPEG